MEPEHPCDIPLPVLALGETWRCPDCGAGWIVDGGVLFGKRWERTSWTWPYVD
jgi:hypothetical protein